MTLKLARLLVQHCHLQTGPISGNFSNHCPKKPLPHFATMMTSKFPIQALLLSILAHAVVSTDLPVPSPVQCHGGECTISYYQDIWIDRTPCKAAVAVYPTTEEELIQAVAYASKTKAKVKVVSRGSHSIPKLVCPGGNEGLIISTRDYNTQILVNLTERTATVDAGIMLRDFVDYLAEYGLTLPHTPYWEGVSVAGMISTGAHGSGMWGNGSSPHDYVVGMRLIAPASEVEGYAKIVVLTNEDADLNAARLSLGVLGAISKVTFELEPMFKRSVTLDVRGDDNLEEDILQFAKHHEFGGLNWYPSSKKSLFKLDDRVGVETVGDGAYKLAFVDKMQVDVIESLSAAAEASEEERNTKELCAGADILLGYRHSSGDGLVNRGNTFSSYPVVGFNNQMQTAGGCDRTGSSIIMATGVVGVGDGDGDGIYNMGITDRGNLLTCCWNPLIKGFSFFDTAISIPARRIAEAIAEIKKLREMSHGAMCGFGHLGGIYIRFLRGSKAYLGEREDAVVFEMMYYRSREGNPRFNEHIAEEIEQMLLHKFGGKPHWGKNRDLAFEGMRERTLAMDKFLEARSRFDPEGLFSSEWTDAMLGISSASPRGVQTFRQHCALEGLCICREDSHCHPSKGYFCRPGLVYTEARVCKPAEEDMMSPHNVA